MVERSRPSMVMEPEESGIMRKRERRKVVLPEPEGPMTASLEPAGMVRVRFLRAGGALAVVVAVVLLDWGLDEEGGC